MPCSKLFFLYPVSLPTSQGECVCCLRLIMFKSALIHYFSKVSANAISIIYQDLKIVLKIGKIEEKMIQTVGVRQGDCMAPVLILFMVMAFAETLEK